MATIRYQHDPINRSRCGRCIDTTGTIVIGRPGYYCDKPSEYKMLVDPETGLRARAYAGLCFVHMVEEQNRPEPDDSDD